MPANHFAMAIDQDRDIKTENLDAAGDLSDLLPAVAPRVGRKHVASPRLQRGPGNA